MAKVKFFDDRVIAKIQAESFTEFYTWLTTGDFLIMSIKSFILAGVSPVSGVARRFQRYSQSYLDFLAGKLRFVTMNGKVRPVFPYKTKAGKGKTGVHSPLNIKKGALTVNSKTKTLGQSGKFPQPFPNKKKSPVNLYATGEMMNSLNIRKGNGVAWVGFADKKAIYHDKLGAGKSKVIRRLLPTRQGEKFISNIDKDIRNLARLSVFKTLEKNKTYMKINFVLSGKR